MLIHDWDLGVDGTIGISGHAADSEGRLGSFVAWISADSAESVVVRTGLYSPRKLAVAPDGSIWTSGYEFADVPGRSGSILLPNAKVIRHFDRSGKVLHAIIAQSSIGDSLALSSSRNVLRATHDRVVWYSIGGLFVEVSHEGQILASLEVPLPGGDSPYELSGFALTSNGDAFVSSSFASGSGNQIETGVFVLDRVNTAWTPLVRHVIDGTRRTESEALGFILGADGERLVMSGNRRMNFCRINK